MLKRLFLFFLLLTCMVIGSSSYGEDANQFIENTKEQRLHGIASVDHALYLLSSNSILLYEKGEKELRVIYTLPVGEDFWEAHLLSDAKAAYVLQVAAQKLYRIFEGQLIEPIRLDFSWLEDKGYMPSDIEGVVLQDDTLFALLCNAQGDNAIIARIPLDGALADFMSVPGVLHISPYQPGQILALMGTPVPSNEERSARIVALSATSGAVEKEVGAFDSEPYYASTFAFSPSEQLVYYFDGMQLFSLSMDGTVTPIRNLHMSDYVSGASLLAPDLFAYYTAQGLYVSSLSMPSQSSAPLIVQSFLTDSDSLDSFERANPDIQVTHRVEMIRAPEIAMMIRTGEANADIYCIKFDSNFQQLMQDGFMVDLSESTALVDAVKRMYPCIQDTVWHEGKLYAYPITTMPLYWSARTDLLQEVGLSFPDSYLKFLELYRDWYDSTASENTDIQFSRDFGVRVNLLIDTLIHYERTYGHPDKPLSFDHPALRQALQIITSMPPSANEQVLSEGRIQSDLPRKAIFETWDTAPLSVQPAYVGEGTFQLFSPPPFEGGASPLLPANLYVYIINPLSKNKESAIKFLEHMIENARPMFRYLVFPDLMEPLPSDAAVEREKELSQYMEELLVQLKSAPEDEKRAIQEKINQLQIQINFTHEDRWLISPEALKYYRETAPYMVFFPNVQFWAAYQEIRDIMQQLLSGGMTIDQAIAEMDKKMDAAFNENI